MNGVKSLDIFSIFWNKSISIMRFVMICVSVKLCVMLEFPLNVISFFFLFQIEERINRFIQNVTLMKKKFEPMDRVARSIV